MVGVGPGDPQLMTLQAVSVIENCSIFAVPCEKMEDSVAYHIAEKVCDLSKKRCLSLSMPMTKDLLRLEKAHKQAADAIIEHLSVGEDVAFLTLGDPSIFATTSYVGDIVEQAGYETKMISGVPSFVAAAARLGISLGLSREQIHIIPASFALKDALLMPGTRIFMKAGKQILKLKDALLSLDSLEQKKVYVVERLGMEEEVIKEGVDALTGEESYFTLVIVKDS